MLQRVWRCRVKADRAADYEAFARHHSVPMFRRQQGYRGCIMARAGDHCEVLTLWADQAAIDALERSEPYAATVAMIRAQGFLIDELGTRVTVVHEAEMTP
jgi:heme-degrading monooxygenase HmoA